MFSLICVANVARRRDNRFCMNAPIDTVESSLATYQRRSRKYSVDNDEFDFQSSFSETRAVLAGCRRTVKCRGRKFGFSWKCLFSADKIMSFSLSSVAIKPKRSLNTLGKSSVINFPSVSRVFTAEWLLSEKTAERFR